LIKILKKKASLEVEFNETSGGKNKTLPHVSKCLKEFENNPADCCLGPSSVILISIDFMVHQPKVTQRRTQGDRRKVEF